jgi:hypothetical protein
MADYDFPPDLLQLQRDFFAAETRMTEAARADDDATLSEARDTAREVAVALNRDEWLNAQGDRFSAHLALREAARAN